MSEVSGTLTLMRMIRVNILTSTKLLMKSQQRGVRKYFCVSTDKAANPVNLMGASKLVMEECIFLYLRSFLYRLPDLPMLHSLMVPCSWFQRAIFEEAAFECSARY